jgi:hypothetical protein
MQSGSISHFDTRVIRHRTETGSDEFAVHEVYYGSDGRIISHTLEALSPRRSSIEE